MPDWLDERLLIPILGALAAVGIVWVCRPEILLLMGVHQFQVTKTAGPRALDPADKEQVYQQKYNNLVELGFQPLGILWTRIGQSISCGAYIFRLPEHPIMAEIMFRSHHVFFVTCSTQGGCVETMDFEGPDQVEEEDYKLIHAPRGTLAEALTVHLDAVAELTDQGHQPLPVNSLDDCIRVAETADTHPAALRMLPLAAAGHLLATFGGLTLGGFLGGAIGSRFGFFYGGVFAGIIVACLALIWVRNSSSIRVQPEQKIDEI